MTATAETINKLNTLNENNFTIIVNLVDYLSASQDRFEDGINLFEAARKEGKKNPMTEDEAEAFVYSVRRETNASGH